jgi:hypothetical protein
MTLQRKPLPPRREREPGEFANYKPRARPTAAAAKMATNLHDREPVQVDAKVRGRVNNSIRESARDEHCLLLFAGCRTHAIWSHNRYSRAGKGKGIKALDINGCYACSWCDGIYDGQIVPREPLTREQIDLRWYAAHDQSLVKLARKGLL